MTNYINYEYLIQKHSIKKGKTLKNGYDEDTQDLKEELNNMGEHSWELCAIIPTTDEDANFIYKRVCLPKKFKISGEIDYKEVVEEEDIIGILSLRNVLIQLHNQLDYDSANSLINNLTQNINEEMKELLGIEKFRKFENILEIEIDKNGVELQNTTTVRVVEPNNELIAKKEVSFQKIKNIITEYMEIGENEIDDASLMDCIDNNK